LTLEIVDSRTILAKICVAKMTQRGPPSISGSEEELCDVRAAYIEGEGDMDVVMDTVMCATGEDETRFTAILSDLIARDDVPDFPAFSKESKKKKDGRKRRVSRDESVLALYI
jgi:hypothetical protein